MGLIEHEDQCKACNESRHRECEIGDCKCECFGLGTTWPEYLEEKEIVR